ncbi:hypothetical protein, partial [Yersinia pestis]|uniref:hypothetical protein n=2 Tax=Yersinia pestis TaxID=632 RepID=UPI001D10B22F
TANCFNKSKGVFITDPKLKALLNPQPSWGFSGHNKRCPYGHLNMLIPYYLQANIDKPFFINTYL